MEPGTLIATRGSGTRLVELRYETTIDGVDYGVTVGPTGATGTPTPIVAALAKGYWERPDVAKHGSHDQSSHGRRGPSGVSAGVASSIVDRVRANGGLSVSMLDGSEPAKGFMVAKGGTKGDIVDADDFYDPVKGPAALSSFLKTYRSDLTKGSYLGLWHNQEDGKVYLDVSDNIQDRARAVRLGKRRNQISIWDITNKEEINTGGTGELGKAAHNGATPESDRTAGPVTSDGRRNRYVRQADLGAVHKAGTPLVIRFEPGLTPVLKHGSHDQKSHAGRSSTSSDVTAASESLKAGKPTTVSRADVPAVIDSMRGHDKPVDLTNLHIREQDIFSGDGLGIARADMPQIPATRRNKFLTEQSAAGVKIQERSVDPTMLKPTQREMNAVNVAGISAAMRAGRFKDDTHTLIASSDGYILDGHHRWGAAVVERFRTGRGTMRVTVIDRPIRDLLDVARDFNEREGIESRSLGDFGTMARKALVRFAPGLIPLLKHGTHNQKTHAGRQGRAAGSEQEGGVPANIGYGGLTAATGRFVSDAAAERGVAVKDVEKEFERRIEAAKNMPDPYRDGMTAYEGGLDWYSKEAYDHAVTVGGGDAAKGAGMTSALSAQNPWPSNKNAAIAVADMVNRQDELGLRGASVEQAWEHYKAHHKEYGNTGPVTIEGFGKAWRIGNGESVDSVLTGRKRRNFHNNILGDTEAVTVDVHMMKALSTTPGSQISGKAQAEKFWQWSRDNTKSATKKGEDPINVDGVGYTVAAQAVVNVARRLGLEPRQVQAIVWNTCVKERWVRPPAVEAGEEAGA